MTQQASSVRWSTADLSRSGNGYEISVDVEVGPQVDQQTIVDARRGLPDRLEALLGHRADRLGFMVIHHRPDGDIARLAFVTPMTVVDTEPAVFRRAVETALAQAMGAAGEQHVMDDAARADWLAAIRETG